MFRSPDRECSRQQILPGLRQAKQPAPAIFGIGHDLEQPTPLRETGRRLGITSDAVRKLERKALAELAASRELDGLRPAA